MNPHRPQIFIFTSSFFGAGLVHSLRSPGDIWFRAALTATAAILISGLLALLLPHRPQV